MRAARDAMNVLTRWGWCLKGMGRLARGAALILRAMRLIRVRIFRAAVRGRGWTACVHTFATTAKRNLLITYVASCYPMAWAAHLTHRTTASLIRCGKSWPPADIDSVRL